MVAAKAANLKLIPVGIVHTLMNMIMRKKRARRLIGPENDSCSLLCFVGILGGRNSILQLVTTIRHGNATPPYTGQVDGAG